jgi:hypothetical protein
MSWRVRPARELVVGDVVSACGRINELQRQGEDIEAIFEVASALAMVAEEATCARIVRRPSLAFAPDQPVVTFVRQDEFGRAEG